MDRSEKWNLISDQARNEGGRATRERQNVKPDGLTMKGTPVLKVDDRETLWKGKTLQTFGKGPDKAYFPEIPMSES